MRPQGEVHYRYHSLFRRALYSFIIVISVLVIGTVAFHYIEHYSYVDSFYFVSMLATAEGPATTPATALGKIAAAIIAFVSIGAVVFSLGFIFGPFFGKLIRMEEEKVEREEHVIEKDVGSYRKRTSRT